MMEARSLSHLVTFAYFDVKQLVVEARSWANGVSSHIWLRGCAHKL